MRFVFVIVLALLLGACATGETPPTEAATVEKPDTGHWKFTHRNDPITGAPVAVAWIKISEYYFIGGQYESELALGCFKGQPVVRFLFNQKIGSDKTGAIAYRFDENPGHDVKARFFARAGVIVIEDKAEVAQFAKELATAEFLRVRITALTARRFTEKFPVHGGAHAIEAAYANCPLPAGQPRRHQDA